MLVDGTGQIWHQWVILRIEETQRYFFADGTPRQIDFSIVLAPYEYDA